MVKAKLIKIDEPNCFIGIDLDIFDKVKAACNVLNSGKAMLSTCNEVTPRMVLLYESSSEFVRIRILSFLNPNTFKCFLIDHGRIEIIEKHRLFSIPTNELQIDPAVKMYRIPGVIPAGLSLSNEGAAIKAALCESKEWIRASYKFVARVLNDANNVVNISYLRQYSNDKAFVEVTVNYNNSRKSLKDLLILEHYAFAVSEDLNKDIENRLSSMSLNGVDEDYQHSLSDESISKILDEPSEAEDEFSDIFTIDGTSSLGIDAANYDSLTTNRSTHGTLDEISLQILRNKVKSWCISKSTDENERGETVIKYEYLPTIRPILSYQKDEMISKFLKDAMVHYKTKLLLLIQSFMIPTIIRGINIVAIAPARKGKSLGLLMPIIQKIATKPVSKTRSFNPLAIILCASWVKVKELSDSAKSFIGFIEESFKLRRPTLVTSYAGIKERKNMIPILAGCDILIVTPKCLLRMLKTHEFFKLNELEILALDDAENLIAHHLDTLKEILIYKQSGCYESNKSVHMIVTATNWTPGLQSFVQNEMGNMFMLTVNNPLEIAVFERLQQKLVEYNTSPTDLYKQLLTYLEMKESTLRRTIVFASDDRQIRTIYRFLMQKVTFDMKLMIGAMTSAELKQTEHEWNQYRGHVNMPVLLISDEALGTNDISIFNAQTILHADLNPSTFGARINFLRDRFSELSFLEQPDSTAVNTYVYHSYVFVCPETMDLTNASFLYKFFGRCNCERPAWLKEKATDYILYKERSKVVSEICGQIKVKGECQFPVCDKRHIVLSEVDKRLLPNRGQIKFRLLYLRSPSNFFVRILEHKVANESQDTHYKSQYTNLKMHLMKYFSDPKNIQGVNPKFIKPGFIAAIKQKDILERVMVIKLKGDSSPKMKVNLIDHGSTMVVEKSDLLTLPKDLQDVPAQAVEVFVTGIRPLDNDEFYHEESRIFAEQFLDGKDLYGVIMLCIGKSLWLDSVTQLIHHKATNISVYEKSLSVELIETAFAEKNPGHVQKLIRLCTGKIDIWKSASQPESLIPIPIMRRFTYMIEPLQFEGLMICDPDDDVTNDCTMLRVLSPNLMLLCNRDTKESIKQMQKEIMSLIDSIEIIPLKKVRVSDRVLFCLDGNWLRGYVLKVDGESVLLFSLDWGMIVTYTANDYVLKKLPTEYQELPYHVIFASLCHCDTSVPYSDDVNTVIENFVSSSHKKILLSVTAHSSDSVDPDILFSENLGLSHLDICQSLKRYSVSITKQLPKANTEDLFYVLVNRRSVVPLLSWVHIVLPECAPFLSRLEQNSSVPHLAADILRSRDLEKRLKLSVAIERITARNIQFFLDKELVSSNVDVILNTLFVLIHFVSEQPVFMCYYRSLAALLNLAYTSKLSMYEEGSEQEFSITYVSEMLYSYQSIMAFILGHINVTMMNGKLEDGAVFLEMLKLLLVNSNFATNFFEEDSWVCVMATCVGVMQGDERLYNSLMDMLVQLVMLTRADEGPVLAGIISQCCMAVRDSSSESVWCSSVALLSCVVNTRLYYPVFKDLGFFDTLLDKTLGSIEAGRPWAEVHENSLEILVSLWRNGSSDRAKVVGGRKRDLSGVIRVMLGRLGGTHEGVSRWLAEVVVEESSGDVCEAAGRDEVGPPETDAVDWDQMKGCDATMLRRHRRCRRKLFQEHGESSDEDGVGDAGGGGAGSVESDSDSSNVEVDTFIGGVTNPADEDNVLCYDLP